MSEIYRPLILLVIMSISIATVHAKSLDANLDKYFKVCASSISGIDRRKCLVKQYDLADVELEKTWQRAWRMISSRKQMPQKDSDRWKMNFIEGQEFWKKYREAECLFTEPYKYLGTLKAPIASISCFLRVTITRITDLETYLDD